MALRSPAEGFLEFSLIQCRESAIRRGIRIYRARVSS